MSDDGERSGDGFLLDENGIEVGVCNDCGEEVTVGFDCCEGGEVVPHE